MATKKSTSKKAVKKKTVKKVEPVTKIDEREEEPSWYHYFIVLFVIVGVFYGGYLVFSFFENDSDVEPPAENIFTFSRSDRTYNIHFFLPVEEVEALNYPIEFTEEDLFRTNSIYLSFKQYNGTDNGYVTQAASKISRLLSTVYFVPFEEDKFVMYDQFNCDNSTFQDRVFVFDPYADENGVFVNPENGCVTISSTNALDLRFVGDAFIYSLIREG